MTEAAVASRPGFRERLAQPRPVLYLLVIVAAALIAYLRQLHVDSIFACPASGYSADRYLAYCQADHYGDYEHGAFWFGLEPGLQEPLSAAQVVFLGNSRIQWGFSNTTTADWFARASIPYYLLGFSYDETYRFEGPLLQKFDSRPRVYVISLDAFFATTPSEPARYIEEDEGASLHYRGKHIAQWLHRAVCGPVPALCGGYYSVYRSRRTGAWFAHPLGFVRRPVSADSAVDPEAQAQQLVTARAFLDSLPVSRDCVILTMVPTVGTKRAAAAALAAAVDRPFISPEMPDLVTFDGSHLEQASAQRWAAAFLEAAGPRIRQCATLPSAQAH